ncbi:MAG: acetate--CoA ligase [Dehalococcoidia bacterium]|nr:MAG: acetate--CoA ligase [Dehalococcoidia bacterium]
MDYPEIAKPEPGRMKVRPNLDAPALSSGFDWQQIENELRDKTGEINLPYLAIDRHATSPRRDKPALIWEGRNGKSECYSFGDLALASNRFANVLSGFGIKKGDRVFTFLERVPELYAVVFGTLKLGAIIGPLFADFGPEPVRDRLRDAGARVLVTSPTLKAHIADILAELPELEHIIIVDRSRQYARGEKEILFHQAMDSASPDFTGSYPGADDYAIMHYTSGTTGKPKGAVHIHRAAIQHYATGKWVLDFHENDIYWCTADPGWVTGTSYGMFAPWTNGITQVVYEGGFRASAWYSIIEKYRVTVWYTAPTAIRMLMKAGEVAAAHHDLGSLRHICSVGEPLNPEAVMWGLKVFQQPIHDNWWQTETGAILIANYAFMPVRPGSMGRPIPGVRAAILGDDYTEVPPGTEGHLAIRPGWPSMFQTYWHSPDLYQSRFKNGWYITGDRARTDGDGYFWFVGRTDDVINTAGHLVGPFEVESALIEHPAVAEAGVIGKPDPIAMEVVKAFVSLKEGYQPTPELRRELVNLTRRKLAAAVAPREIEFLPSLPKTRSGKIMRRLLKAKELGLPLGDTSTLEEF